MRLIKQALRDRKERRRILHATLPWAELEAEAARQGCSAADVLFDRAGQRVSEPPLLGITCPAVEAESALPQPRSRDGSPEAALRHLGQKLGATASSLRQLGQANAAQCILRRCDVNDSDRPVGELLRELSEQTTTLVRKELELAKLELTEKGKQAGIGVGMFGGAGVVGLYAAGALTACFILALATAVTAWLSALIVAAVYGVAAGVLALTAKSKVKHSVPPVPEQATESVKEDVQWTKTRAKQGRN